MTIDLNVNLNHAEKTDSKQMKKVIKFCKIILSVENFDVMKRGVFRLFNLYTGEGRNTLLLMGLAFLWSLGARCGDKLSEALFLVHVGADALASVYVMIAIGSMTMALIMMKIYHKFELVPLFSALLVVQLGFYGVVYLFSRSGADISLCWYAIRVTSYVLYTGVLTGFWTFIDQYHHLQDAKRLYSLISAALFFGFASAGLLIRVECFDLPTLYLAVAGILLGCIGYVKVLAKGLTPIASLPSEETLSKSNPTFRELVRGILRSRFTLYLLSVDLLVQLLMWVAEYNYMSDFERIFSPSAEPQASALFTGFIGKCMAWVGMGSLLFGLLFYSRLVKKWGANNLEWITPVIFFVIFLQWTPSSDSLLLPLLAYATVEGIIYVIDDNNFNLLIHAVPAQYKYKIRVAIESFFEPLGQLLGGVLLTLAHVYSKQIGMILSGVTILFVWGLRSSYIPALYQNLRDLWQQTPFSEKVVTYKTRFQGRLEQHVRREVQVAYHYWMNGMQQRLEETIENIMQLLAEAGVVQEAGLLSSALLSQESKRRGEAIEILERACGARLFWWLEPVLADVPAGERLRLIQKRTEWTIIDPIAIRNAHLGSLSVH